MATNGLLVDSHDCVAYLSNNSAVCWAVPSMPHSTYSLHALFPLNIPEVVNMNKSWKCWEYDSMNPLTIYECGHCMCEVYWNASIDNTGMSQSTIC